MTNQPSVTYGLSHPLHQQDEISKLIGKWDSQCPASDENTTLLLLLTEMRKRIVLLEEQVSIAMKMRA